MSQSKTATPEPTEIAGRYEVVQKLGAGAFGTVYKVRDKLLKRMLAIKTIRLEGLAAAGASLEEMLDRFRREAEVSAQLKHPNIVTIYDIGVDAGMSYLAMEFIGGTGLEKMILSGKLPLERAASLGAQVADALDFAHKNNVVHRDIKPANIMVEAGDRVKVTDFGIAKVTDSGEHLTMTGSLLGTPSYMSPEQARGGQIDGRSDLFSLGCVLYEMLAGKKAFRGESITALIFKIITEEPPDIRDLDPGVPDEMVRIITKAISKAPEARYQTGREMADDLLALTRAESTPTMRQVETPTAPGKALSPTAAPTLASPPTLSSSPTAIGRAAPPTQVAAVPPTQLVPPPGPRAAPSPAPPRAASRPAASPAEAPRKSGAGAGLLIGLGLAGLLFVGLAAGAAWYLFLRKPADSTTVTEAGASRAPLDTATAAPTIPSEPSAVPSSAASPAIAPSSAATPAPSQPTATPTRSVEGPASGRKGGPASGSAGQTGGTTSPGTTPGNEMAFLDNEEPIDNDGRAAGEALAQRYKSDQGGSRGSTYGTTGRFRQRERNPRPNSPNELAAIKTLRYVIDNQEAFHRKNSRYGTLLDLFGRTPLDVPHNGDSFQRRGYRFNLEVTGDGFKISAMPVQPGPRPFLGDDSGIIRPGLE